MDSSVERAERLYLAAKEANGRGRPAVAASKLDLALSLLDGHRFADEDRARALSLRARLLITLAWSQFDMHGMAQGDATLRLALDAAAEAEDLGVVALARHQRGLLLARSGALDDAMPELDEAISLIGYVAADESPALYLSRGNVRLMRGMTRLAREDFRRCTELARAGGLTRIESKALHNLGYAEYVTGNLAAALDVLARADQLDGDVPTEGLLDRAQVLMEAGLLEEADEALTRAGASLRRRKANQARAEANLARAEVALMQQRWTEARSLSIRASRDFRRRQGLGWQAKADLTYWQALLEIKGGPSRVVREVARVQDQLLAEAHAAVDPAHRHLSLVAAEAHLAIGHAAEAARLLEQAGRVGSSEPLTTQLREHLVRAGVSRAAGDVRSARRELATGLNALAKAQARHQSLDLRTAMAVHGERLARLDLTMAAESGSATAVFDSLERWRAMSQRRTAVTSPADPELADLLTELRTVAEEMRSAPQGAMTESMARRRHMLEHQVREREWRLHGDGRPERSVTLARLRPALLERTTDVVAYFVLDHRLGAVAIRNGKASVVDLAPWAHVEALMARVRADLDALAARLLPAPLRLAISRSLGHDLEHLDRLLVPDMLGDSGALLVVPSQTLGAAPWTLLPSRRARPTTVALSATGWLRGLTSLTDQPRVTAMAGPGLVLSGAEVREVADQWPGGRAVTSLEGSAGGLAAAMRSSDLVHVAAHGSHNQENPLFSSIRLADGPLYAYDIPAEDDVASHVVLSACDLGLLTPRRGGEVLGLTAALLGIGARCVVSGVSRIDDHVAYETMVRYHSGLASGLDSPTALAHAVDGDLSAPAGFVCFGSPWDASAAVQPHLDPDGG